MAELDYSAYINEWETNPEFQAELGTRQAGSVPGTFERTYGVAPDSYADLERLYLGDLSAAAGFGQLYWAVKTGFLSGPYNKIGSFDFSGFEIIAPLQTAAGSMDIRTPEGYAAFMEMPEAEQFAHVALGINPLTGKVYETFAAVEWSPGGICITPVTGGIERLRRGGAVGYYDDVWHVTVYGRVPGSVLVDMDVVGRSNVSCYPR